MSDIWKDPRVIDALNDGRTPDDIALLPCPKCGALGYYNEGSHFSCLICDRTWYCCSEGEEPPDDRPYMWLEDVIMLSDATHMENEP